MLKRFLIELNLFKTNSGGDDDDDQSQIRYQRITTRLYIGLLVLSFIILTTRLAVARQIYVETAKNSSQAEFSHYYSLHNSSLQCACSSISFPYYTFLTIKPHYHQMYSSDLFSPTWLNLLQEVSSFTIRFGANSGFDQNAGFQFLLLKKLRDEAKKIVTTSLEQFLNQTFIATQLISEETFEQQINASIEEWRTSTINSFIHTIWLTRDIQYGNHLVAVHSNSDLDLNEASDTFILNSSIFYEDCNCISSPSCLSTMKVYANFRGPRPKPWAQVPGFFMGCFRLKALLNSTLESFYNQTSMNIMLPELTGGLRIFNISFSALNSTRNLPNETIDSIVSRLFVDDWSQNISFSNYFTACNAQLCTYTYTDQQNLISLVTSVISIFGGLVTGLKIVFLILLWLVMKIMKSNLSSHSIRTWLYIRLTKKQYLIRELHITFVVTTLITLYFTSTFTQQIITEQSTNPIFEKYEELLADYPDTLQCPCVQIYMPYKLFMNVSVSRQHQVCSSFFITDEWIETLPLPEPQSSHSPMDFNKTAISFFQLLGSLCELSKRHVTNEISDLMKRNFINTHVISRLQFNEQIKSIIDQFELNTQFSFLTTLQLIRAMTSDNHIMTVFETNWKWMPPRLNRPVKYRGETLHTKPIVYNGSCNCGLFSQCVEESSTMPGLMVGCYPLESLLKSTLQCLYNASCISLLQSTNQSFASPIDYSQSRYQKNSTVEFILNQLMVEEWNKTIEYEKYYNQCAPSSCSYWYVDRRPALQVLTLLLKLNGGLVILMNVVALLFAFLWQKILIIHQRRTQVQPT